MTGLAATVVATVSVVVGDHQHDYDRKMATATASSAAAAKVNKVDAKLLQDTPCHWLPHL
jgi:hypothetical protein